MKNQIFIISILIIGIFLSCSKNDDDNNNNDDCSPTGLLTYEEANTMEENYKTNQYAALSEAFAENGVAFSDKREFKYSVEELQCYLDYVKKLGNDNGIPVSQMGIRVYLGAKYENDEDTRPKTQVFFVPTVNSSSRSIAPNETFYPAQPKDYGSSGRPPVELETQN